MDAMGDSYDYAFETEDYNLVVRTFEQMAQIRQEENEYWLQRDLNSLMLAVKAPYNQPRLSRERYLSRSSSFIGGFLRSSLSSLSAELSAGS